MYTLFNSGLAEVANDIFNKNKDFFDWKWSQDRVEQFQLNQLKETIRYVKKNSPFYQNHFSKIPDEAITSLSFESFSNFPFTDKSDLRESMYDILSKSVSDTCYFYETTGTTGPSTPCPRDIIDSMHSNTAITFCYETILRNQGNNHIVGIAGPTELHSFGDTLGDVCKNLGLPIVKLWPYSPVVGFKKAIDVLCDIQVSVLMCTPGMALSLAKAAKHFGYQIDKDLNIQVLMLTGELGSRAMMKNIESIWGARTFNFLYGSQEETLVLSAVVNNHRMHTFPLNYFYEVVDPDSQESIQTTDGIQLGELVVTMLFQGAKPLVRYRTGDLVRLIQPTTKDKFPSATIEVLGRIRDVIQLNNHRVMAYDLEETLMTMLNQCLGYQITISQHDCIDHLFIQLEMASAEDEKQEYVRNIAQIFNNRYQTPVITEFTSLGEVTTTGAMVSWKAARIIDKRIASEDLEKKVAESIAKHRERSL